MLLGLVTVVAAGSSPQAYEPPPGTPERKAILDGLRGDRDVVFVVKHLKTRDGWAWVHVLPQSSDGTSRFEDESALLQRRKDGSWQVVDQPCSEPENPDCPGPSEYYSALRERFPSLPAGLFPAMLQDAGVELRFVPDVAGCAVSEDGTAPRARRGQSLKPPEVVVEGGRVRYERALRHLCCRTVALHHEVEDRQIRIVEMWTGRGCRCHCSSTVGASLEGLPAGRYTISVRRTGTEASTSEPLPLVTVLEETIQILPLEGRNQ